MLSARTIYGEIFDHDEAFGLFCSIAASGEAQGGWENIARAVRVISNDADNHLAYCREELLRLAGLAPPPARVTPGRGRCGS